MDVPQGDPARIFAGSVEARHAGLSHALHRWLATKLDADALRRVERAREQA